MARLLLEARSLSTLGGGVRRYTVEVIRRLLAMNTPHEIHVAYDGEQYRGTFPSAQEHVIPVYHPLFRMAWDMALLPLAIGRIQPDLIHYFKPAMTVFPQPLSIATMHDVIPLLFPKTQTTVQRWYWNVQLPLVARRCAHLLTLSEQSKKDIVERLQVPPDHVTATLLGVDEQFRPASEEVKMRVREQFHLPKQFYLFVGTLEPRKNVARLLRAYASIHNSVPHDIVLAGKWGSKAEEISRTLKDPRLQGRVHQLSYVPSEALPALYSAADAFVFPSLYEGFGLPPLEAMASGTPVVTSSTSSLPEVVGSHGLLVHPEDESALAQAMERIVSDRELHDRLVKEGLERARVFTWERTARETLAVYEKILAQR